MDHTHLAVLIWSMFIWSMVIAIPLACFGFIMAMIVKVVRKVIASVQQ